MNDDLVKMRQATAQVCNFSFIFTFKWKSISFHIMKNKSARFFLFLKVLASQKRLENKYKTAEQASEDW